jgi:hypothetical protein
MYVSRETDEQTRARLRRVLAASELVWLEGAYAFAEYPVSSFPVQAAAAALAAVRDEDVWSVLSKAGPGAREPFALFTVHFPDGVDNSGFVGWLASVIKKELGTGIFCVCGQNSARGGIFDYWGVPLALRAGVEDLLGKLAPRPS